MIPAFTCLLLPLFGGCSAYVRDVPAISAIEQHRAQYTGKAVSVTGRVANLDRWRSRNGTAEEVFSLCDGGCVRVYMAAHSDIRNGQLVTVRGSYYQAYRVRRDTYFNEVEATEVLPRE